MASDILQFILFAAVVTALTRPLGLFMAQVYAGRWTVLSPVLGPLENGFTAGDLSRSGSCCGKSGGRRTRRTPSISACSSAACDRNWVTTLPTPGTS